MPDPTHATDSKDSVTIERIIDAPVELVWRLWTDPAKFSAWYGPTGASLPIAAMDVRVGGTRHICMQVTTPNGPMRLWFTGTYLEVVAHQRLVYTESMSNEAGDIIAPSTLGMPADHPITTEIRLDLQSLGSQTKMVMTHAGIPPNSPGATGWLAAFDKLNACIGSYR